MGGEVPHSANLTKIQERVECTGSANAVIACPSPDLVATWTCGTFLHITYWGQCLQ